MRLLYLCLLQLESMCIMYGLQILCLKSVSYCTHHSHNSFHQRSKLYVSTVPTSTDTDKDTSVASGSGVVTVVVDSKSFLRSLLSPGTKKELKQDLLKPLQQLRFQKDTTTFNTYIDSLIAECNSVTESKWANRRYWVDLPSYRVRRGIMNRLVRDIIEEEKTASMTVTEIPLSDDIDTNKIEMEQYRRSFYLILTQLVEASGVKRLEQECIRRQRQSSTMDEMLQRTPNGLETPKYKVLKRMKTWELRRYDEFSVCSTYMDFNAGNEDSDAERLDYNSRKNSNAGMAFNSLAGYIFGQNQEKKTMAMTTPVISTSDRNKMSFVMPSDYWGEEDRLVKAPIPIVGSNVRLEQFGGGLVQSSSSTSVASDDVIPIEGALAVMWFGGYGTRAVTERNARELKALIEQSSEWMLLDRIDSSMMTTVTTSSSSGVSSDDSIPRYYVMQYNDPFQPPWKRRNEVAFPVVRKKKTL